jgi:hypothetical protein
VVAGGTISLLGSAAKAQGRRESAKARAEREDAARRAHADGCGDRWGNAFDALPLNSGTDAVGDGDDVEEQKAKEEQARKRVNKKHRRIERRLVRRARGIRSAKTLEREAAQQRRRQKKREGVRRRIACKAAAAAAAAAKAGKVKLSVTLDPEWRQKYGTALPEEEGPFCRDLETVAEHMAAEPKPDADMRHTREMVSGTRRKTDLAALDELLHAQFISREQHDAAVRLLRQQLPAKVVPLRQLSSGLASLVQGRFKSSKSSKSTKEEEKKKKKKKQSEDDEGEDEKKESQNQSKRIEVERARLHEMGLLGFITAQERRDRELQLDAEQTVRARRRALEKAWFELSRHQHGPLADEIARSTPATTLFRTGPLGAALIAGSDPRHAVRGTRDLAFVGERGGAGAGASGGGGAGRRQQDVVALSLDRASLPEIARFATRALGSDEMAAFDKKLPSVAA